MCCCTFKRIWAESYRLSRPVPFCLHRCRITLLRHVDTADWCSAGLAHIGSDTLMAMVPTANGPCRQRDTVLPDPVLAANGLGSQGLIVLPDQSRRSLGLGRHCIHQPTSHRAWHRDDCWVLLVLQGCLHMPRRLPGLPSLQPTLELWLRPFKLPMHSNQTAQPQPQHRSSQPCHQAAPRHQQQAVPLRL